MSMYVELSSMMVEPVIEDKPHTVCPSCKLGTIYDGDTKCNMCTFDAMFCWTKGGLMWVTGKEEEA